MRFLSRLAVIVAFAAIPAGNQALAQWVEHKPAGIGYRIEMPAAPQIQSRDIPTAVGPIKTTMALVDRGPIGFIGMGKRPSASRVNAMKARSARSESNTASTRASIISFARTD